MGKRGLAVQTSPPMTDFATLLSLVPRHMRADPADPLWPDRDRLLNCRDDCPALAGLATRLPAPPGQAFGASVGMALAERLLTARFGKSLVDHRTWLVATAAELASGTAQEAAAIAGALRLGRLAAVVELTAADTPIMAVFVALGWAVRRLEAPSPTDFSAALVAASRNQKPTLIACTAAAAALSMVPLPVERPPVRLAMADLPRAAGARRAWLKRARRHAQADAFFAAMAGKLTQAPAAETATALTPDGISQATHRLVQFVPELCLLPPEEGGADPAGLRSMSWHGRDQAVGAMVLGMALHGGVLPVARLGLAAAEAVRPSVRVAANFNLRCGFILLEEGPGCPVGGLRAAWRAMRNLLVLRPADATETAECLGIAMRRTAGPSLLLLSNDAAVTVAPPGAPARTCARGAYRFAEPARPDVTLIASGAELHTALALREALRTHAVNAAIVSMPCWTLFAAQDPVYRATVLGTAPRIGLEAGSGLGWSQWLGEHGVFLSTDGGAKVDELVAPVLRVLAAGGPHPGTGASAEPPF